MPRTNETKVLAELDAPNGSLLLSNDGKTLFVLAGGNLMKVGVDDGKVTAVQINTTMELNTAAERDYMFEHVYKQFGN